MSDRTELKIGDVVTLKSGGPKMVVTCITPSGDESKGDRVGVQWFDGPFPGMNANCQDASFDKRVLLAWADEEAPAVAKKAK